MVSDSARTQDPDIQKFVPIQYRSLNNGAKQTASPEQLNAKNAFNLMLLTGVIPLPLNQPLNPRGAYIQFTLAHLQRHDGITEGFPGKRCLFALLEQYRWRVHVDQLSGWRDLWFLDAGYR